MERFIDSLYAYYLYLLNKQTTKDNVEYLVT